MLAGLAQILFVAGRAVDRFAGLGVGEIFGPAPRARLGIERGRAWVL